MSDWLDKAKDFVSGHADQAEQALDKAEEFANEKTGGKYADQIDQGTDAAREHLGLPPEDAAPAEGAADPA